MLGGLDALGFAAAKGHGDGRHAGLAAIEDDWERGPFMRPLVNISSCASLRETAEGHGMRRADALEATTNLARPIPSSFSSLSLKSVSSAVLYHCAVILDTLCGLYEHVGNTGTKGGSDVCAEADERGVARRAVRVPEASRRLMPHTTITCSSTAILASS